MVAMATPLRYCKLCGCLTTGSVGAAGLRWPFLCQPCKDREDGALAEYVEALVHHDKGSNLVLLAVLGPDGGTHIMGDPATGSITREEASR